MMPVTFVKVQKYRLDEGQHTMQGPQQRRSEKSRKVGQIRMREMTQGDFSMQTQESKRQSQQHEKTVESTQTSQSVGYLLTKMQRQLAAGLQTATYAEASNSITYHEGKTPLKCSAEACVHHLMTSASLREVSDLCDSSKFPGNSNYLLAK